LSDLNGANSRDFTYTISEKSSTFPGWTADSSTKNNIVVRVTDDGEGNLSATVVSGNNRVFSNSYAADPATAAISASKISANSKPLIGGFEFEIREGSTLRATGMSAADGTITFTPSSFTYALSDLNGASSRDFTYTISEKSSTFPGWTEDAVPQTVVVRVTDDGEGNLSASVTSGNNRVFSNTYSTNDTNWTPEATKTSKGKDLDRTFTFAVYEADGTTAVNVGGVNVTGTSAVTAGKSSPVTFTPAIPYTLADLNGQPSRTYSYVIEEESEDGNGWVVDKRSYSVTVTVADDGEGKLEVTSVVYKDADGETVEKPTFTNIKVNNLTIDKRVIGTEAAEDFEFVVALTLPEWTTEEIIDDTIAGSAGIGDNYTYENGVMTFTVTVTAGDPLMIAGIPAETEYTVTEKEFPGYELIYINGKPANGAESTSGTIPADEPVEVTFTNNTSTDLTVSKKTDKGVDGIYIAGEETIYYTITVKNNGTTTLYGVFVADEKLGLVGDEVITVGDMAPGETVILTGDRTIAGADIEDGEETAGADGERIIFIERLKYEVTEKDMGLVTNRAEIGYKGNPDDDYKYKKTNFADAFVPGIKIEKIADKKNVFTGSVITYTIKVTNIGGVDLVGVLVEDALLEFSETINLEIGESVIFEKTYTVKEDDENITETRQAGEDYPVILNTATATVLVDGKELSDEASVEVRVIELSEGDIGIQKIVNSYMGSDDYKRLYEFKLTFKYDESGFIGNILDNNLSEEDEEADEETKGDKALRCLERLYTKWQEALAAYEELLGEADEGAEGVIDDELLEEAQRAYDEVIAKARKEVVVETVKEIYDRLYEKAVYEAMQAIDEDTLGIYDDEDIIATAEAAYDEYISLGKIDEDDELKAEFIQKYLDARYYEATAALKELVKASIDEDEIWEEAKKLEKENAKAIFQPDEATLKAARDAYDAVIDGAKVETDEDSDIQDALNNALLEVEKTGARYERVKKLYEEGDFEGIIELMMKDVDYIGDIKDDELDEKTEEELAEEKEAMDVLIRAWLRDTILADTGFIENSDAVEVTKDEEDEEGTYSYTIKLKANDVVIFRGIPEGMIYTVEEVNSRANGVRWWTSEGTYEGVQSIEGMLKGKVAIGCENIYYYIVVNKRFTNTPTTTIVVNLCDYATRAVIQRKTINVNVRDTEIFTEISAGIYWVEEEVPGSYNVSYPNGQRVSISNATPNGRVDIVNTYVDPPPPIEETTTTTEPPSPPTTTTTGTEPEGPTTTTEVVTTGETTTEPTIEEPTTTTVEPTTEQPTTTEAEQPTTTEPEEEIPDTTPPLIDWTEPTTEPEEEIPDTTPPLASFEPEPTTEPEKPNPGTGVNMLTLILTIAALGASAVIFTHTRKRLNRN
jgi:pilin isopeptide linkage protein/uncharacterized repeat protein (TIGR01451 family)